MKETVQLTYDICSRHGGDWQALGRNYITIRKSDTCIIFHWLDLDTVKTGAVIKVKVDRREVMADFPDRRHTICRSFDLNTVPVQPFEDPKQAKVWTEFLNAMQTPVSVENLDRVYNYDA